MFHPTNAPDARERRVNKPKHDVGEDRRPTLPRPVVRTELFGGWGPKL